MTATGLAGLKPTVKNLAKGELPMQNEKVYLLAELTVLPEFLDDLKSIELAPRKIRVNQVTPGATRTPIWSLIVPTEDAEKELEQRVSRSIPLGRFSEADEVAKAVLYLPSDDSVSVSGTEIVVDGGATGAPLGAPIYRSA
jgi:NADP-dependent 3-hydroxy acid dehydrogenase YdfG